MIKIHIKTALSSLFAQKLRAFLAMLGVLVGTASVVALVSSGQLASLHAMEQFRALGTNLLSVSIRYGNESRLSSSENNTLHVNDVWALRKTLPDILEIAPYVTLYPSSPFHYKNQTFRNNVVATTATMANIVKLTIAKGRFISPVDHYSSFCVIGATLASKLRNQGLLNPLGQQIKVGDHYLEIIGVANTWPENMFLFTDLNTAIIVPIDLAHKIDQFSKIRHILFRVTPGTTSTLQAPIQEQLLKMLPKAELFFRSPQQIIAHMNQQRKMFTWLLGSIGSIALIVGGIGIMNIMLVSVIERKREIGIRLAIGARDIDIQSMFLCEAIVLTLIGGTLGVLIGLGITILIAVMAGWHFYILLLPVLLGFAVSVLVGLFFGFYPARRASQLNPVEALRAD